MQLNMQIRSLMTLVALFVLELGLMNSPPAAAQDGTISGFTEPMARVEVASPESGLVDTIDVREGADVSAGQIIARLDTSVSEASLALARARASSMAEIDAAAAKHELRSKRLAAIKELHGEGHANVEELDRARMEARIAAAELKAAEKKVELAALEARRIEAEIERRVIRSPIDGVVIRLEKKHGEFVSVSEPVLATIANLDQLRVKFYLPTNRAKLYRDGQSVDVFFPDSQRQASGRIHFVSPVTDADSGTVRVEIAIDNQDHSLSSGVRCNFLEPVTQIQSGATELLSTNDGVNR